MGNVRKSIRVGSDCSGVGALIQALNRLGLNHTEDFACDYDYYARQTYCLNYGTEEDYELSKSKEHKKYADGVKKIALSSEEFTEEEDKANEIFLNEANEFAKRFSFYFPFNMYQREIPEVSNDIYVSSVPCQSFSLAGKRLGESDKRGVLFYNSHEYIAKNKPRYFIFENVKGLLSDNKTNPKDEIGQTFQSWLTLLGGKSTNGVHTFFPHEDSVPYHIYWKVLNAKNYGVPQNRERVFIVGIRDDEDNDFHWAREIPLEKRLKDVLEDNVDEKYYLSEKMIKGIVNSDFIQEKNRVQEKKYCDTLLSRDYKSPKCVKVGYINQNTQASQVFSEEGTCPTLSAGTHVYAQGYVQVKSATKKGFEIATENDSINLSNLSSETKRGRVGKQVAQTLDTSCNQGVMIGAIRGRNPENPTSRESGLPTQQMLEINEKGTSNTLTTVQKDNVVVENKNYIQWDASGKGYNSQQDRAYFEDGLMGTLAASNGGNKHNVLMNDYKIRRLTPLECFRLMDFNKDFKWEVSDTQAYKQAGNSIVVACFVAIISRLKNFD